MTPHIESKKEDIAKIVLMPGDPLRAKYIAENFLENARLVNSVRNILAYTGTYKGKEITVFSSGMGMPSMGIYCYELYKFYDVDTIIRIGSCGGYTKELNLLDTILVDKTYTPGNFALALNNQHVHIAEANREVNGVIEQTAKEQNIAYQKGNTICSECFDYYVADLETFMNSFPQDLHIIGAEMEAFALFYTASYLNKRAACLLSVVDNHYKQEQISSEAREKSLNTMISLALESAMKL